MRTARPRSQKRADADNTGDAAMHVLLYALFIVFCSTPVLAQTSNDQDYLVREELQLPTDGNAVHTTKPLEAFGIFRVVISSPYDLSAIQSGVASILFDGETMPLDGYATGLYGVINHLFYYIQGKGRPLEIRITESAGTVALQKRTPVIAVKVFRYYWWESRHGNFPHPLLGFAGGIAVGVTAIVLSCRYFAPERFRRFVQFYQSLREEVMPHFRPIGPVVRVVERPHTRRPETPPIRIIHHEDSGAHDEDDRD
jgi:hypothetical protein